MLGDILAAANRRHDAKQEQNSKTILDGIAKVLETVGYVHMANAVGIKSILDELDAERKKVSYVIAQRDALAVNLGSLDPDTSTLRVRP